MTQPTTEAKLREWVQDVLEYQRKHPNNPDHDLFYNWSFAKALLLYMDVAEAAEIGAFHHNSCPWLAGDECLCAKQQVDEALAKLRTAVPSDAHGSSKQEREEPKSE